MKRRLSCLLLSALLLGLAACGGPAAEETPSPTDPLPEEEARQLSLPVYASDSLHPALGKNRTNAALASLLYEGLFALDESFTPQMVLCRSYTCSADGLTWRFTLRSGVRWSDGTDLTAGDAAAALNTARGSGSRYAGRLRGIAAVEAEGEDTVVVTLSSPNGALPALLDIPLAKGTDDRPAGTGPYSLADGEGGLVLTLRRDWWRGGELEAPMERISLLDISGADDLLYAFDTREIDLVVTDLTDSEALGFSSDYAVWEFPTTSMIYLGFRCAGDSPCADGALRAAISAAVDRTALASSVFAHHAAASALPVSPASPLYDGAVAGVDGDKGAALAALERGTTRTLTLLVCNENAFKLNAAASIAEALRGCGLAVTVRGLSFADYCAALAAGEFDLYLGEVAMTADFDPTPLIGTGGSLNYGGYADEETEALLSAFRAAGEEARTAAARALYRDLTAKAPIAPLCFKSGSVLTQWGRLKGLRPTAADPFYGLSGWMFS